ncbi:MAG: di-heme oxidoredictase family protein [Candidatus Sericytochromatia bacterium]|nr:di-heme oxidoredictase family protein [Candidatus Sericytochromatia bacterium]
MPSRPWPLLLLAPVGLVGCHAQPVATTGERAAAEPRAFVRSLQGLSAAQREQFARGRALYEKTFTPAEGLGPLFNRDSCRACHGQPGTGGGSALSVTLVAVERNGAQLTLKEQGAPMIQERALGGVPLEQIPMDATVVSHRISPPTFGLGLLEAIPAADVTAQLAANPARAAWGVRGKANWEFNQLGRFGWKAQKGDMVDFTQQACQFELGLSSPGRPQEHFPNLPPQRLEAPANLDDPAHPWVKAFFTQRAARGIPQSQPDLSQAQIDDMVAFQRWQAPPEALPRSAEAEQGRRLFEQVGCATCHVPAFQTGPNALGVPAGLPVRAYSDLLIHDMGEGLADGLLQGVAGGRDWRTPPLWGLRHRTAFMHDGRTDSLHEASMLHGGEGARSRDAYSALSEAEQLSLEAFLRTL